MQQQYRNGVKMREEKSAIISIAVFGTLLAILLLWVIIRNPASEGIQVQTSYNDIEIKGERIGILKADRVEIQDTNQKIISVAEFKDFDLHPQHIVLGEDGYYLFQLEAEFQEKEENLALVAKFDYQSNFKSKILLPNIGTIACEGGKLYLAERLADNEETGSDIGAFLRGFYANYYIDEKDFGKKPVNKISKDDTKLFYHKDGFFSTEPEIGGYTGVAWYKCDSGDVDTTKTELVRQRKQKSFTQICENIDLLNTRSSITFEYQDGEQLYGVSNVLKKGQNVVSDKISCKEVDKSYFYKIDCSRNKFEILKEVEEGYGILATENYVVVQKENKLYKMEIGTDKSEVLLDMDSDEYRQVLYRFQGSILQVSGEVENYYLDWDENDIRIAFPL